MLGLGRRTPGRATDCPNREVTRNPNYLPEQAKPCNAITVGEALQNWTQQVDRLEARWMLQSVLAVNSAFLIAHADRELSPTEAARFRQMLKRRAAGEPVAYLTGERGFYDLILKITPDVLIPRPETELLVETALSNIALDRCSRVLDLGTGSGAIALTIAKHRPLAQVTAVDLSSRALAVAHENAQAHAVDNVTFVQGDWYSNLPAGETFDVIVANPPYIAEGDPHLAQGDLRFEPDLALVAKHNGWDCIRQIITHAAGYLHRDGWLLLEHGYDQAGTCRELLEQAGFASIFSRTDLAGIERVSGGQRGSFSIAECL